jgi:MFS transporter, CP family, cyanate transporter
MKALSLNDDRLVPSHLIKSLCLLWLVGLSMRITILAVPPVIPPIHDELRMTEAQIGLLMGLPLMVFAIAAVPGSLLVARLGTSLTLTLGMVIAGVAAAGRGGAEGVTALYAATVLMGFGIAIMQPALPALVREWLPNRVSLGSAVSTNGMLVATTLGPALTIPLVLPLVGNSWRLDLVIWALPLVVTALLIFAVRPRVTDGRDGGEVATRRWWPDWSSRLTWLLGLAFGSNNSIYFTANAFLPDYLAHHGQAGLVAATLASLNGAQLLASFVLMVGADRVLGRTWPYVVFGPVTLVALAGIIFLDGYWVVLAAGIVGFAIAVTFVMMLAAPPALSPPGDVHRTAAGMFTISYTCGVLVPIISGSLWDLTGVPWIAFVPLCVCAVTMAVFGVALSRYRPKS